MQFSTQFVRVWLLTFSVVYGQLFDDVYIEDGAEFIGMAGFAGNNGATETPTLTPTMTITPSTISDSPTATPTSIEPSMSSTIVPSPTPTIVIASLPIPYGTPAGDVCYNGNDDVCFEKIKLSMKIPLEDKKSDKLYVCPNGLFCIDKMELSHEPPDVTYTTDKKYVNTYCVAPYFTDMDTRNNGEVCVHVYDFTDTDDITDSVFDNFTIYLDAIDQNIGDPVMLITATWVGVPRYINSTTSSEETVTFQYIYVTDGQTAHSFVFYEQGGMEYIDGDLFIGQIYDESLIGVQLSDAALLRPDENVYIIGRVGGIYLSMPSGYQNVSNYEVECLKWVKSEKPNESAYQTMMIALPTCPCSSQRASLLGQWWQYLTTPTYTLFTNQKFVNTKTCAYGPDGDFLSQGNIAGTFKTQNPVIAPQLYQQQDERYRQYCCDFSDHCQRYYQVRPRETTCQRNVPMSFQFLFGDPHMITLDGFEYTFNGHGEYTLLQNQAGDFTIQCRTDRLKKQDDTLTDGTVFSGFALKGDNTFAQVTLDHNTTGMEIIAGNGAVIDDFTFDFNNNAAFEKQLTNGMTVMKKDGGVRISFPEGVVFTVTQGNNLLTMSLGVGSTFRDKVSGLLGNYNGDTTDDLIPKESQTAIPTTSTDSQIFNFGKTWVTTAATSIFKYDDGESWTTYNFPDFTPKFISDEDPAVVAQASATCGGDKQCIFDLVFTGDESLALQTKTTNEEAIALDSVIANQAPSIGVKSGMRVINGDNFLYVVQNQPVTFSVNASDDETFTYALDSSATGVAVLTPDQTDVTTAEVKVTLPNPDPKRIKVLVTDNKGLTGSTELTTVFCSGCNNHGTCNFEEIREDARATDYFKFATCECTGPWEGTDCETAIVDQCDPNPCSLNRACTNVPATGGAEATYTCAPCPDGYVSDPNVDKECVDEDECTTGTNQCSDLCKNTIGSYECDCSPGYRLGADAKTCADINECEEGTSVCKQLCTNTAGGATCSCFDGFTYNAATETCTETTPTCALDCSSADGCVNDEGTFKCVCKLGFTLTADNKCVDTDECAQPICSQVCTNSEGSFSCSCHAGYELLADKITCEACKDLFYGDNCESKCQFSNGVTSCDHVTGPVCNAGYRLPDCVDIDECTEQPDICGDVNKVCANTVGSYTCTCRAGFTAAANGDCVDVNECDNLDLSQCSQQCINNIGGYSCGCDEGYIIDVTNRTNCLDIDECTQGTSGCEHTCENTPGRFRCVCYAGFVLSDDRKNCVKIQDPCETQTTVTCAHICRLVNDAPICSCRQGYTLGTDSQTCTDIDECASTDTNKCSEKDSCVNTDGGYTCSCQPGFKLDNDGRTCTACDDFHYGANCENNCECRPGATRCDPVTGCVCRAGWSGAKCDLDRNECSVPETDDPCKGDNLECVNTLGSYICQCKTGFTNNSAGVCEDVDECSSITGLNECAQTCTNTVGSYTCSCLEGFIGDGKTCQDINECDTVNDCSQICTNTDGGYRCSCNAGYNLSPADRTSCTPEIECAANACTNAACVKINNVDTCTCNNGFVFATGSTTNCVDIKECDASPGPCSQNCIEQEGGFTCNCDQLGFKLDVDKITCIPCTENMYGANCAETCTCIVYNTESCNAVTGACTCKPGWAGTDCSQDVNECATVGTCPALSVCQNTDGSYVCVCNNGYFMSINHTCYDEDECSTGNNQCEQICTNTPGSHTCSCRPGFQLNGVSCTACTSNKYGDNCAQTCNCNATNSVDENQTCNKETGSCICKAEWSGPKCEVDVDECLANTHGCSASAYEGCHNTIGSFVCSCLVGYKKDSSNNCEIDPANVTTPTPRVGQLIINFFVRFNLSIPDHVDLNVTQTNAAYKGHVESGMSEYLRNKMGILFKALRALTVAKGSLDSGMSVDIGDSTKAKQAFANAIFDLTTKNETVAINNEPAQVERLTVKNTTIDVTTMNNDEVQCHVYELINEQCQLANHDCKVENGKPVCERPEGKTDIALLVGLGVGIPLLMILATIIGVVVYRICRNNQRSRYSDDSDRGSSAFSGPIPTRINTQRTDIPYLGFPKLYDDDMSSFASDTESRRQLSRHMRQGLQYDEFEEQGNTWGYLYRYIEPTTEFKIKRPQVEF